MRVSCIIPTKDRCQMVLQAIASALAQQNSRLEVVLVDDGSTDGTAAEAGRMFPEIKIIKGSGLGPGMARNAGVLAASGDIMMFLDSDDLWFPHHTESLLQVLRRGFPVAYGVTRTIDEINGGEFMVPHEIEQSEGDCYRQLLRWCFLLPSAVAVSREAFATVNGFGNEHYGEDWIFFLKLAALFPFGFAACEPITLRRLHKDSLCCLSGTGKIIDLIRRIIGFLKQEARAGFDDIARFMRMEEFVTRRGAQWSTVQDWYLAMKEEEMI